MLNGLGLGWRRETAWLIESRDDIGFVEVIAEQFPAERPLPHAIEQLIEQGISVIPHGIGLSVGDAHGVDPARLDALCHLAERLNAPLISEHIAFVRAGELEAGHLLPVPRTDEMLDILAENIAQIEAVLPVPLVLENIATLFEWPAPQIDEATFIARLAERCTANFLLDVANLYANGINHGWDVQRYLQDFPIERITYVHMAGGHWCGDTYIDSHAAPISEGPLNVLRSLVARGITPPTLLERDDNFVSNTALGDELDAIAAVLQNKVSHDAA